MPNARQARLAIGALLFATSLARAQVPLAASFKAPPEAARPPVGWHWMNGNVSPGGIDQDFASMKRVGTGGPQRSSLRLAQEIGMAVETAD